MRSSVIRLHHPTAVRTAAFSCSQACPVHAVVGLDNGCLYRSVAIAVITPSVYPFSSGMTSRWVRKDSLTVYPWRTRVPFSQSTGALQREVPPVLADGLPLARWIEQLKCGILQILTLLAVASNAEFGTSSMSDITDSGTTVDVDLEKPEVAPVKRRTDKGDAVEIWDVRRGHIAKWQVGGSSIEGGVTGTSPLYAQTEPD